MTVDIEAQAEAPVSNPGRRHLGGRFLFIGTVIILLAAAGTGFFIYKYAAPKSPVPQNIARQVNFPVYYPDAKKLPAGYTLNTASFTSPTDNVILYSIRGPNNQRVVVSLQNKPSSSDLQTFNNQRIPLHTTLTTPVGQAIIGAIGNQSITSLPTQTKTWIIVTAPYAINQSQLNAILKSFKS